MATTNRSSEIGPRVPSNSSPDYGRPFGEIFARYNNDFYRIDPLLFSPGFVVFVNVDTGKRHEFGRLRRTCSPNRSQKNSPAILAGLCAISCVHVDRPKMGRLFS